MLELQSRTFTALHFVYKLIIYFNYLPQSLGLNVSCIHINPQAFFRTDALLIYGPLPVKDNSVA